MANTGPEDPTWSTTSRCSCSSPGRSTGSDSGGTTSPASPGLSQTRLLTFPGSMATTSVDAGSASCSKPTTTSRPCGNVVRTLPQGRGQRLSAEADLERGAVLDHVCSGGGLCHREDVGQPQDPGDGE